MLRKPLALAAAVIALALQAPAAHAAIVPGTVIDGPSSAIQHFNDLDLAPDGTGALVYTKHVGIVDDIFVSTFNGSAWSAPQDISTTATCNCAQARVAAGNGGRVVVTFVDSTGKLLAVLRPNGGSAFGAPVQAAPGSNGEVVGDDVDMDPASGVAYAVIDQAGAHVRATRLSGSTWTEVNGAAANLDATAADTGNVSSGEQNTARVAIDSSGNAVVAWPAKDSSDNHVRVFVRRIVGTTASDPSIEAMVPSFAGHADANLSADMVNIDGGGSPNPWVVFRELFDFGGGNNKPRDLARQLVGNTFSPAQVLDGLPNDHPTEGAEYPQVDINASGQGLSAMPRQLSFQAFRSRLVAGAWSTGFRLDSGTPTLAAFPSAAIADTGNGLLAWHDSSGSSPQISAREDVGGVLGAPFVISKAGAGDLLSAPDAPIVASSSSAGTVAVGFGQSNGGVNSVVVAVIDLPQPPPAGGGGGTPDKTPPTISRLKLSATKFRLGSQLATFSRKRTPIGTTISFSVSEQSTTTFTFARKVRGFKSGKRCVAHRPKGRKRAKRCTRFVNAKPSLRFATAAGAHKLEFEGRLNRRHKLKPGRYRLSVRSTDAAGNKSKPKTASFTLLKK